MILNSVNVTDKNPRHEKNCHPDHLRIDTSLNVFNFVIDNRCLAYDCNTIVNYMINSNRYVRKYAVLMTVKNSLFQ